jgi:hypothetical protein
MSAKKNLALLMAWAGLLPIAAQGAPAAFPLKASADHRYLVDQNNQPFLLIGDSPWSIIVQPSPAEVDHYLENRAAKGFNAMLVNLLEHKFSTQAPNMSNGTPPFTASGDFATPNDAYFCYAEEVIDKAAKKGFVLLLCPAYLGYEGKDEGFFQEMVRCGPEKVRAYGRYVGKRFRSHPNIIWVVGGDFTPPRNMRWTVDELAAGILEEDRTHLMTVHCGRGGAAATQYPERSWLQLNDTYVYRDDLYGFFVEPDQCVPRLPCFLIETCYEGEHQSTPDQIRRQAYWPLLCGQCGFDYGNSPLWHFGSIGVYDKGGDWVAAMDSRGGRDMAHAAAAFRDRPWWKLRPDYTHNVVTAGYGDFGKTNYVVTARSTDGKLAMSYLASTGTGSRELTIDMSQLAGPVAASWYNPTDGGLVPVSGSPFANSGSRQIKSPGDNGAGANDWLLILETRD